MVQASLAPITEIPVLLRRSIPLSVAFILTVGACAHTARAQGVGAVSSPDGAESAAEELDMVQVTAGKRSE